MHRADSNDGGRQTPPPSIDARADLIGLDREALRGVLAGLGVPARQQRMRGKQLWRWLYNQGAVSFSEMTDLGGELRCRLEAQCRIGRPGVRS